jgi:hypothetical protein
MVYKNNAEGFETLKDKIQNRANPLAAQQNPLANPAAPIGISEAAGKDLTRLTSAALNIPTATPTGLGNFVYSAPTNPITPRIDNENSFLGLVKFCSDSGKGANPFSNAKFNENCGMCITSGSLITGQTFTKPTGVVVYKKDKEKAMKMKDTNKYRFPRVLPSLNAAVCKGASVADDALPVLAINGKDYNAFQKRQACIHGQTVGKGCGMCQSNNKYSWVDPNGGTEPFSLVLYGLGKATVRVGGRQIGQPINLNETQGAQVNLGRVPEGRELQIENVSVDGPYVYGALISTNSNGKPYRIAIEKIIEKDSVTGSTPRRGTSKLFNDVRMSLMKLIAKANSDRMILTGQIPLTFVESDQLAAYDCPSGPFFTKQESLELLTDDNCVRPKGQKPGNYSDTCLQGIVLESGCSSSGNYYKNPSTYAKKMSKGEFKTFIEGQAKKTETDVKVAMDCLGINIKTPCDDYLGKGDVPNKQCMEYLYANMGAKNKRLGPSYREGFAGYTSLSGLFGGQENPQFCQPWGSLNPGTPEGEAELRQVSKNGYKGLKGMEAVKLYLSDIYKRATSNLDANKPDDEGGKKDSWKKCFGFYIADPKIELTSVSKNGVGTVQDAKPAVSCSNFPKTWTPKFNTVLARNFYQSGNYEMSFKIKPKTKPTGWANIIHLTKGGDLSKFGDRSPAIWLHPNMFLHVRIGSPLDINWGIDSQSIPVNQVTSFRLSCKGNQVILTVNERTFTMTQPGQRPVGMMTVYGSNPFNQAANCDITEFCLQIL